MKKYLIPGLLAMVLTLGGAAVVSAQSASTDVQAKTNTPPMILQVNRNGRATLRGTVDGVNGDSLMVKSWGGDWKVNVSSSAKVLPGGSALSDVKVGDTVGVLGTVSQSEIWTIDATLVNDWSAKKAAPVASSTSATVRARDYVGTASNVSASSFDLTSRGTAYTVSVASDAKIVNRAWKTIGLSDIQNGNNVRVWGTLSSSTITAKIVRDVSLPVTPVKKTGR